MSSSKVHIDALTGRRVSICLLLAIGGLIASSSSPASGRTLLDDKWADGRRAESNRPTEAAVWIGRKSDIAVKPGVLSTTVTPASQKLWLYFTEKEPVKLAVGQKLVATVSFIPRGNLSQGTSRGLRIGLFHDPTGTRVESDTNSDGGGNDAPWTDAKGYAVHVLLAGGDAHGKPFDLGKRTNLESKSLLGTSSDYTKLSGGEPVELRPDTEYTVVLEIEKKTDRATVLTSRYKTAGKELSCWSVADDGVGLGADATCDTFDLLFVRISNKESTADKIDFTNFKVELAESESTKEKSKVGP